MFVLVSNKKFKYKKNEPPGQVCLFGVNWTASDFDSSTVPLIVLLLDRFEMSWNFKASDIQ